jgi:GDP-L-fucose synthase
MTYAGLRVAVLGGTGFAGRNVCEALERAGITVEAFSRATGCDLLNLPAAQERLRAFRPDYMINCAALVGSLNYVTDLAADVVDTNMRIITNVYKIAQQLPDAVVVNPVANCAYPGTRDTYREEAFWDGPIHPSVLAYGSTRRMMVVFSKSYSDQYQIRSVNLITPNMYGPYDSVDPNKTHALNALVVKFVKAVKHDLPTVEVWGTGKPIREWLYVRDFAQAILRVVAEPENTLEPVNIAQNQGYSVKELADTISRKVGYAGEIVYNTSYQDGSPKKVMDDRRFRQRFPEFGFTDLARGISETIEYYREVI